MFQIIKKTKFIRISILMLFLVIVGFSIIEFGLEFIQKKLPDGYPCIWLLFLGISLALICLYWATILLYPRIYDFVQDKEKYELPEVRSTINKVINFCYILLAVNIGFYFFHVELPVLYSLIGLVFALSLFVGFVTLASMFSKAKSHHPFKKEQLINSIAFVLFIGSSCIASKVGMDLLSIKYPFFAIFVIIAMNIVVYKRVNKGNFFE